MGPFFGRTLGKFIPKRAEELKAEVHLCAFGKHPGWDDHIEDLGLDSERLVAVRRVLYIQGIGGNVDSGAWDTVAAEDRLEGFRHLFVWHAGGDLLIGRMWSSRDGKGRTRYPMVVCTQCTDIPLRWALKEVLPRLEALEERCAATTAANEVRAAIAEHRQGLRKLALAVEPVAEPVLPSTRSLARLAGRTEMGPDHLGIHRVLYQIEREMAAYLVRGAETTTGRMPVIRPHHMRVPQCAEPPAEAVQVWLSFLLTQLHATTPILLVVPLDQPWLDVIVGEPTVQQFYSIRASLKAIPLATEIPYTLEHGFTARYEAWIEAARSGEELPAEAPPRPARPEPAPEPEPAEAPPGPVRYRPPPGARKRRLRKLLPIILLVLLILALLLALPYLFPSQPRESGQLPAEGSWQPSQAQAWSSLCRAYYEWFARFRDEVDADRLERWRQDPDLASTVVARIEATADAVFDPRRIAGERGDLEELADSPPESARTPEAVADTAQALAAIRSIEHAIAGWGAEGKMSLRGLADAFAERGWTKQAEQLRALADRLTPDRGAAVAAAIDVALAAKRQAAAIESAYARLGGHAQALAVLGEAAPALLRDHVLAQTRTAETLDALQAKVAELERSAAPLGARGKELRAQAAAIGKAGGAELAGQFLGAVRAMARADDLAGLSDGLGAAKGIAPGIAARVAEIQAQHEQLVALGDKALAEALWDCARAETRRSSGLLALHEKLVYVKTLAPQLVARRAQLQGHREGLTQIGDKVAARVEADLERGVASARSMDGLLRCVGRSASLAEQILARWQAIQKLLPVLEGSGDRILARFGDYARARAAEVAVQRDGAALVQALDEIQAAAKPIADIVQGDWKAGRIERKQFVANSSVHRTFDGKVTRAVLEAWRAEVAHYYRLDAKADPRVPSDSWTKPLGDIAWRIGFLTQSDEPVKRRRGEDCAKRHRELEAKVKALLGLPWIKDNEADIERAAKDLRAALARFQADLEDVVEPPASWLKRIREHREVGASHAINQEWALRRDALVPAALTPEKLQASRADYEALWRRVAALQRFLVGLDDAKDLPKGPPEQAKELGDGAVVQAVAAAAGGRREQALKAAVDAIPWGRDGVPSCGLADFRQQPAWRLACRQYAEWRRDAGRLLLDFHRIERALDAGYLLDSQVPGLDEPIGPLYVRWQAHELFVLLRDPLKPVTDRVAELMKVGELGRDALVRRAKAAPAGGPPEAALAIWLRLGELEDWPGTADELATELELRAVLAEATGRVRKQDEGRAKWLGEQLKAEAPRRWARCFRRLTDRVGAEAVVSKEVARVFLALERFDVREAQLPPDTRLRVHLHRLRARAHGLRDDAARGDVAACIATFQDAASSLPGDVLQQAPVAAFLADLKAIAEAKEPAKPGLGLAEAGPVSSPVGPQWKPRVGEDGAWVVYEWAAKGHTLRFVRVEPTGEGARPAYVATTEVSVGLFIDMLAATDRWVEANALLRTYNPDYPPLKGPRTWEWQRNSQELQVARRWLAREARAGQHYPDGLDAGAPGEQHPVQYVSVGAALFFARLMGCRLPTAAEWQAALLRAGQGTKANLRDATWGKQHAHVRGKHERRLPADWPDADIFWPDGAERVDGKAARVATTEEDGVLWFAPVGQGDAFRHLTGNVAEFVFDRPDRFETELGDLSNRKAFILFPERHAEAIFVVGASALSPPELWNGQDKPFDRPWAVRLAEARDGYADVGFRLAFAEPHQPPALRLKRLLATTGYFAAGK